MLGPVGTLWAPRGVWGIRSCQGCIGGLAGSRCSVAR